MSKTPLFTGLALFTLSSFPALAGVVITQNVTQPDENGADKTTVQTLMIEGSRQKTLQGDTTTLVDLDKDLMVMLDAKNKTATEMPLSGMGQMMKGVTAGLEQNYKSTGGHKTIAGYSCDEYSSEGKITMMVTTNYTAVSCFSTSAPGASEYSAFAKKMMDKMGLKITGNGFPAGVVLSQEMTTQPPDLSAMMKGMPPEAQKQMAAHMPKQKAHTTRNVVTSIKTQSIAAGEFAVPAGYKRQTMDDMMKGAPSPPQ